MQHTSIYTAIEFTWTPLESIPSSWMRHSCSVLYTYISVYCISPYILILNILFYNFFCFCLFFFFCRNFFYFICSQKGNVKKSSFVDKNSVENFWVHSSGQSANSSNFFTFMLTGFRLFFFLRAFKPFSVQICWQRIEDVVPITLLIILIWYLKNFFHFNLKHIKLGLHIRFADY